MVKSYNAENPASIESPARVQGAIIKSIIGEGVKIRIVYLEVSTDDADPIGNEPVYYDNRIVGVVTSGGYGFRVNKSLAFAYVESKLAEKVLEFQIEIQGKMIKANVLNDMAFDPKNTRLKS